MDNFPGCCDKSSKGAGSITWQEKDTTGWLGPHESGWCLEVYNPSTGMESGLIRVYVRIKFCPYCGRFLY